MRHNSSNAAQKTRTQQQIWSTNPHIKSNFLPLVKHNFVTIERRTLTKTHRTRNIGHMRQTKKIAATLRRRRASSRHTCAQQRCERTCVSCSKLATRGTQMDARNSKRRHERCWRAPQHDGFLESGSLRQPSPKRLRRNTTSYPKNTRIKNQMSRACAPRLTLVCARILRRGAFVHNQREHEARPRTTEHPRTVSAHHNEH